MKYLGSGRNNWGGHAPLSEARTVLGWGVPFSEEYKERGGLRAHLIVSKMRVPELGYRACMGGHLVNPKLLGPEAGHARCTKCERLVTKGGYKQNG